MELEKNNCHTCELKGCIYNEDGVCEYDYSAIKIPSARACHDDSYDE